MPERIYNTPLAKKLGLTPAKPIPMQVALIAAPDSFSDLLGDLPAFTALTVKVQSIDRPRSLLRPLPSRTLCRR